MLIILSCLMPTLVSFLISNVFLVIFYITTFQMHLSLFQVLSSNTFIITSLVTLRTTHSFVIQVAINVAQSFVCFYVIGNVQNVYHSQGYLINEIKTQRFFQCSYFLVIRWVIFVIFPIAMYLCQTQYHQSIIPAFYERYSALPTVKHYQQFGGVLECYLESMEPQGQIYCHMNEQYYHRCAICLTAGGTLQINRERLAQSELGRLGYFDLISSSLLFFYFSEYLDFEDIIGCLNLRLLVKMNCCSFYFLFLTKMCHAWR